ncbi:MAG: CcdB family protein [Steroidobacteraceae bacterium]|nr:CcdB family protein [Steroidobacteraceae bacterium]
MQFDVHPNPVPAARRAYPYVVVLQSSLADAGRQRIVAPLVPRSALKTSTGRLVPAVRVQGEDYAVLVPSLAAVAARDLAAPVESAVYARSELLAALDLLFFGV